MSSLSARLPEAAETFLRSGLYLRNWSVRTVRAYRHGLTSLFRVVPSEVPTKGQLDSWVVTLREQGLTPGGCNMRIRSVNSYLSWLREEGRLAEPLKVKLLRAPLKQLALLSSADVKALMLFKPRNAAQRKAMTLVLLLLDTGLRISEALDLERAKVDFDALTLTVMGKGSKERVVPFSHVCRKILFRYVAQEHQGRLLFGTRTGSRLSYRNAYRAIQGICVRAGVKADVHPHAFRHTFAAAFVKAGGDVFRLSRFLGHSALSTTQLYLRSLGTAELARNEQRLSPLARFDRI